MSSRPDDDPSSATTGSSLDHQHYEQVHKDKVYFHAEQEEELFEEDHSLETLSLAQLRAGGTEAAAFAEGLVRGLTDIGFVYLVDHGIDPSLFKEAHERTVTFFEQTPTALKKHFPAERHGSVNQGYFPYKKTTQLHPDLVEGWVFAGRAFDLKAGNDSTKPDLNTFWPDPGDEPFFRRIYQALEPLTLPLMRAILSQFNCPTDLYDERLTDPLAALRLNYYPPLGEADEKLGAARLLGHEDVTLFTFLPASTVEGLQVFNRATGRWIRLTPQPGTIILNAGDYLQRITNDTLQSSTHRVSTPRQPQDRQKPRTSFPLFVYLRENDQVEVLPSFDNPRYEPIDGLTFHTRITRKFYGDDYQTTGTDGND